MNLQLYRDHLTQELKHLPDLRSQDIQSYVLTTAILCRRIDNRLAGALNSLWISERIVSNRRFGFIKLANILLHYSKFDPDLFVNSSAESTGPEAFTVRVHSDKSRNELHGRLLTFRLADYFDIIERVAKDDQFVLTHLLAAAITRLRDASAVSEELDPDLLHEILSSVDDVIYLCRKVGESRGVSFKTIPMPQVYEIRFRDMQGNEDYVPTNEFPDLARFIDGYGTSWTYSPFAPARMNGGDYSVEVESRSPDSDASSARIALPFGMLRDVFTATRQLPSIS